MGFLQDLSKVSIYDSVAMVRFLGQLVTGIMIAHIYISSLVGLNDCWVTYS